MLASIATSDDRRYNYS